MRRRWAGWCVPVAGHICFPSLWLYQELCAEVSTSPRLLLLFPSSFEGSGGVETEDSLNYVQVSLLTRHQPLQMDSSSSSFVCLGIQHCASVVASGGPRATCGGGRALQLPRYPCLTSGSVSRCRLSLGRVQLSLQERGLLVTHSLMAPSGSGNWEVTLVCPRGSSDWKNGSPGAAMGSVESSSAFSLTPCSWVEFGAAVCSQPSWV